MTGETRGPTSGLVPGSRVVVRHRLATPDGSTGAHLTDVVGDLVAADEETLTIRSTRGMQVVQRATVTVAKVIPPRPSRRGAAHRALSIEDLERVKLDAWRAPERARLGDWVLRAGGGLTHRANSALAIGSPDRPVAEAVDVVTRWYRERGLTPDVAVAGPVGFDPGADGVGAELLDRGWGPAIRSTTMTAGAQDVRSALAGAPRAPGVTIEVTSDPSSGWLAMFLARRGGSPELAREILLGSPDQWFATAFDAAGQAVGRARLAAADGWGGISAVEVAPPLRRGGLARGLVGALLTAWPARSPIHLDVETDNDPARALYRSLGFTDHHEYVNLVAPQAD